MGIINCIHDYSENKEIKIIDDKIFSGEGIFKSDKKTEIITENKGYKEIDILSFSKRKNFAQELLKKGTEESIRNAIDYDNTSFDVIINNEIQKDNSDLLQVFNLDISRTQFEILLLDIIDSANWDEQTFSNKFSEYKQKLNNRIKFNQPIDGNNMALFFYKSKVHILINLLKENNISQFKEELKLKRKIYNKIDNSEK